MGRKGGIISKVASLDREDAYLLERKVPIGNTNKQGLINLAVFARKFGLKVVMSVQESQREVES